MPTAKVKAEEVVEKVAETNGKNPVVKAAHTAFLAGLGSVSLGKEELAAFVDRLVEKGEVAEKDARKMFADIMDRSKKDVSKAEAKVEGVLDERIKGVVEAMNIPSKGDIENLLGKVEALAKKVTELDKKLTVEKKAD